MDSFFGTDIVKLAELLKTNENDSDIEDDQCVKQPYKIDQTKPKIVKKQEEKEDDIEKIEKIISNDSDESSDWRKCPKWDLVYKQAVTPSDIYLQMSGKTQLTSSCEDMVITVELPGEKGAGIDVKLTENQLELVCAQFRLSTPLPHPINPKLGNAKWDPVNEKLILTLRMDREFDYINF
ncbi:uncharacterized protein CBL_05918 [Carabus blaptoides fortunei]